jgi:uncharacterized metal-binding protein YceD (DUF177 family)
MMKEPGMSIEIKLDQIDNKRLEQSEDLKIEYFANRLDERLTPVGEAFQVNFVAESYTNVVSVRGTINGSMSCICSRCGQDMILPITTDFVHRYVSKGELGTSDLSQEAAEEIELDVSEHDGSVVDIAPIAVEQMIVELPFAPKCPEGAENGCSKLGDEPLEFGDTEPLVQEETSWSKALKGLDKDKLKDS